MADGTRSADSGFDQQTAEAFASRLLTALNDGALCLTREYLERAGFQSIETHALAHDIQNNWYVVRK
jgi:hypothetical protein